MQLCKWLDDNNISNIEFAGTIAYDRAHLNQILMANRPANKRFRAIVKFATNGAVTDEDWDNMPLALQDRKRLKKINRSRKTMERKK